MITKKQLKTQIDELTNEIKELSKIVVTDELKNLREIKKLYEEQTNLLSNVTSLLSYKTINLFNFKVPAKLKAS